MMIKYIIILLICLSCSLASKKKQVDSYSKKLSYTDKSGKLFFSKKVNFHTKKIIKTQNTLSSNGKVLEEAKLYSTIGNLKKRVSVLRPYASIFRVWFDQKMYETQMKINLDKKGLDILLRSDELSYNKKEFVKFPKGTGVYCFFGQLVECVKRTGFFTKAINAKTGKMNFHIIWENYPYISEQLLNIPKQVFSNAILEYDGKNKKKENRFTLQVVGQSVFFFVDENNNFLRMLWASQGISIVEKNYIIN